MTVRNIKTQLKQYNGRKKGLKYFEYFNSFHSAAPLWLHCGTQLVSMAPKHGPLTEMQTSAHAADLLFLHDCHALLRSVLLPPSNRGL